MSANINLSFNSAAYDAQGAPIHVEIIDMKRLTGQDLLLNVGATANSMAVADGNYLVRAHLPSGQILAHSVVVKGDKSEDVAFDWPKRIDHEWLAYPQLLGAVGPAVRAPFEKDTIGSTWLRVWSLRDTWAVADGAVVPDGGGDGTYYNFKLAMDPAVQQAIQVGGERVAWRVTMLPRVGAARAVVYPKNDDGKVNLKIVSNSPEYDALATALASGEASASLMSQQLAQRLETGADANAGAGAFGLADPLLGYALLRSNQNESAARWVKYHTRQYGQGPIDPDTLIIALCLAMREKISLEDLLSMVFRPWPRSIPVYTEGVNLTIHALQRVEGLASTSLGGVVGPILEQVQPLLKELYLQALKYAETIDWAKPFLSFEGETPALPVKQSHFGNPDVVQGAVYVDRK